MPWRGPLGGAPLESVPGPANPWLACEGDPSIAPVQPGKGCATLPKFQLGEGDLTSDPSHQLPGICWPRIENGSAMMVCGVLAVVVALSGEQAVAATLPAASVGTAAGALVSSVALALSAGGVIVMGAGHTCVMSAIDPKISDHRKHVSAVPMRKLGLPADLPAPVATFMRAAIEIERLSTAESDILDHARAAARAGDKSWTELHLRDLYHVQNGKQHFSEMLGSAMGGINAAFGKEFDQTRIDPAQAARDLINPLVEMRASLNEIAGLSSAELNAGLGSVRIPSPMSQAIEVSVRKYAMACEGQPSALLKIAAEHMQGLKTVDHEAFGIEQ